MSRAGKSSPALVVLVMAVRASIWSSDFIVGAGAPGGVSAALARRLNDEG